jgi:hypothetical protein
MVPLFERSNLAGKSPVCESDAAARRRFPPAGDAGVAAKAPVDGSGDNVAILGVTLWIAIRALAGGRWGHKVAVVWLTR